MPVPIRWKWSLDPFVRSHLATARDDRRNLRLTLSPDPNRPLTAVISWRIVRFAQFAPEPIKIDKLQLQQAVLPAFERLLGDYRGADLDTTILIEPKELKFRDGAGAMYCISSVLVWSSGVFGAFARDEITLDDGFWIERILFRNELQHRNGKAEEE